MQVLAICERCGTAFPIGMEVVGRQVLHMVGNRAGPCPRCGSEGVVPDGIYEFYDEVLRIIPALSSDRIRALIDELERARSAADAETGREAVIRALVQEPALASAVRLIVPTDPATFWAMVAVLLAVISMFRG